MFCYICGKVTMPDQHSKITQFVKSCYHTYFGIRLGNQDKSFAPHTCCRTCIENFRRWSKGKMESLSFGVPMDWREGKDHVMDCYFCMTNLQGLNKKNKHHVVYPDVPSAIKPMPHGPGVPIPTVPKNIDFTEDCDAEHDDMDTSASYQPPSTNKNQRKPLNQVQLNDIIRDLGLSKESAQLLCSCLDESNLLVPEITYF